VAAQSSGADAAATQVERARSHLNLAHDTVGRLAPWNLIQPCQPARRGEGGFSMMGDFITLTQVGLPIEGVVLNDGTLGFVEMEMKASGFLDTGCDLKNPNFSAVAEAMGIKGIRLEHFFRNSASRTYGDLANARS
jgi:hypothetical protein